MTGNLLRVVDLQARIGAREKAHGAARAAARFVGGHVPEIGAGMAFLGSAALLAGALAPREKAHALPSAVGTPKKPDGPALPTPLSVEEPPSRTLTAPEDDDDSDTELVQRESEDAQKSLRAERAVDDSDTELVQRESEDAQKSLRAERAVDDKGSAEVAVSEIKLQEVLNAAPDDAPSVPDTGAPPEAEAKGPDTARTKRRRLRKRSTFKVAYNRAPPPVLPQTTDGPSAVEKTAAKADAPLVIDVDTANDDLLDAPEPAPAAVTHAGAKGQDLRRFRTTLTRDLLFSPEASARQFCARSRVHDLCEIFLSSDGLDPGSAGLVLRSLGNNSTYGPITPAQKVYIDSVLNDRTMNAKIPENADVAKLVSELGTDLVHARYGHVEVWDVRECTSLLGAFKGSSIKSRLDLSFWDTRKVTDAFQAFSGASFDVDVSTWDVSKVDDMRSMFYEATGFEGDVSEWDVSNVREMSLMFAGAKSFRGGGVEKWESRVGVDVTDMFIRAPKVEPEALEWAAQRTKPAYGRARRRGFV